MDHNDKAAHDPQATGPTDVSASGWWTILKRTWTEAGEDNLGLIASGIAFNAFLAFVPLLTATVLSYGLIAAPEQVARHIAALADIMPQDAAELIGNQLRNMVETAGTTTGFGLLIALAVSVYGAMKGASGIITALNLVFDVDESRSFLGQTGMALAITFGLVLVFFLASVGISMLGLLEDLLPDLGGLVHTVLQTGFWLGAAVFVSLVIALIYRYAPNRPETEWRWLTPGSVLATIVWVAATFAFAFFVRNFGSYNATYGALGAVIIFLTWLYLSAYILLLGAELNQVLERRVGSDKALGGTGKAAEAERKSSGRKT
ncbi:MAG: YihY/virulence factor BrkB family protein [Sphingomicrobium sp.]